MESTKRRLSCPQTVQLIWDAIIVILQSKQQSSLERIFSILKKKHGMEEEDAARQVKLAVVDNLLYTTQKIGSKGSQVGVEQTIYHLPQKQPDFSKRDGHDWYCFNCHKGGSVLSCKTCFRVYHAVCCNREDLIKSSSTEKFICPICVVLKSPNSLKIKKDDLNTLLGYTCNRLKEKPCKDLNRDPPKKEDLWREKCLIYNYVDMALLEERANQRKYRRLEEFEADVQNMVHNVVIYYGVDSSVADMARQMLRDCSYDLKEIQQCQDCYRMSNEKNDRYWFCQPCDPPHELVFAKQKGYPFWPAKVIRVMNSGNFYDVRFFGGPHERATVEKANVRPITCNPSSLGGKRSTSWTRACDEMKKHQEILAKRKKIGPLKPVPKSASSADEEVESEDDHLPKKIDRYIRSVSARSSPKADLSEQFDDWTPIRRSERSRKKKLPFNSDSPQKDSSSEEMSAKPSMECSFEENASEEDKDERSKPTRKSEPVKMLRSQGTGAPRGTPNMAEERTRRRPPSSVPKSLRLPMKPECSSDASEDSNSQLNPSRRTNPKRVGKVKSEAPERIQNQDSSSGKPLPLLDFDNNGLFEINSPNSKVGKCVKIETNSEDLRRASTSKKPASQTQTDKLLLSGEAQSPLGVRTNCKVRVKRLLEDAGPSESSEPDEPKPKKRVSSVTRNAITNDGKASVPDLPVSSSVRHLGHGRTPTPDDLNVVSSSSQLDVIVSQISVGIQTSNSIHPPKSPSKYVQTDPVPTSESVAITKAVALATRELERSLQADLKQEKENALKALKTEFQEKLKEKETKLSDHASDKLMKEVERVVLETENRCKEIHDQEIKELLAKHQQLVSEIKKKQWCYNCENEAIYHCCWNTSYCSTECQQLHWKEEHKRTCRRKR